MANLTPQLIKSSLIRSRLSTVPQAWRGASGNFLRYHETEVKRRRVRRLMVALLVLSSVMAAQQPHTEGRTMNTARNGTDQSNHHPHGYRQNDCEHHGHTLRHLGLLPAGTLCEESQSFGPRLVALSGNCTLRLPRSIKAQWPIRVAHKE